MLRTGDETRSPEEPSWTYSTFVASKLRWSDAGTGGTGIALVINGFECSSCASRLVAMEDPRENLLSKEFNGQEKVLIFLTQGSGENVYGRSACSLN